MINGSPVGFFFFFYFTENQTFALNTRRLISSVLRVNKHGVGSPGGGGGGGEG